jgi:ribosomal protein S18 acetylase RimI-like enzyme
MAFEIKIRKGKIADKYQIVDLWHEMVEYHKKITDMDLEMVKEAPDLFMKYYCNHVRSRNKLAIVAEDNGTIFGYLFGSIQKRPPVMKTTHHAFISDMAVTAHYRKKGIGSKIVNEFLNWSKEKGMKYVILNVAQDNGIGISFWENAGFATKILIKRKVL